MMSLRQRIFVIVSLAVLFILGISLAIVILSRQKAAQQAAQQATTTAPSGNVIEQNNYNPALLQQPVSTTMPAGTPIKAQTSEEVEQNAVKQFAKIFTERYGSYSTDNSSQNIKDVQTLVTDALWAKLSAGIGKAQSQNFVGVSTRVITAGITAWSDKSAQVEVKTVRVEEKNGVTQDVYQTAEVGLVKTDGNWLVSAFVWK